LVIEENGTKRKAHEALIDQGVAAAMAEAEASRRLGMAITAMVQDQGQHKLLANALTLNS
ncbi:hypothetical protein Tco_0483217, partial [Tanacetum coccineum]